MRQELTKEELELAEEADASLPVLMQKLMALEDFSNGRDIITWVGRVYRAVANRRFNSNSDPRPTIQQQDLEISLNNLLLDRQTTEDKSKQPPASPAIAAQSANPAVPPVMKTTMATRMEQEQKPKENPSDTTEGPLSQQEWDQLNAVLGSSGFSLDQGLQNNAGAIAALTSAFGDGALILRRAYNDLNRQKCAQEVVDSYLLSEIERLEANGEYEKVAQWRKELERESRVQRFLSEHSACEMGYKWIKESNGYRCAGGSHFMGDHEIPSHL